VWALQGGGLQAVVSTSFADIFRANALKNGLVPVVVDETTHASLVKSPGTEVVIDIDSRTIAFGSRRQPFPLELFARYCLLNGLDELAFLLEREKEIAIFEKGAGPAPWRLR
jgi:3-isopropylmalate/(R)-2-methylmalate dehydratase small subunit